MENPTGEPQEILLKDLEKEYYRLEFLVDRGNENLKKEMEVSIQAGEIVGKLYENTIKLYDKKGNLGQVFFFVFAYKYLTHIFLYKRASNYRLFRFFSI